MGTTFFEFVLISLFFVANGSEKDSCNMVHPFSRALSFFDQFDSAILNLKRDLNESDGMIKAIESCRDPFFGLDLINPQTRNPDKGRCFNVSLFKTSDGSNVYLEAPGDLDDGVTFYLWKSIEKYGASLAKVIDSPPGKLAAYFCVARRDWPQLLATSSIPRPLPILSQYTRGSDPRSDRYDHLTEMPYLDVPIPDYTFSGYPF